MTTAIEIEETTWVGAVIVATSAVGIDTIGVTDEMAI